ncbi:unnamed protein product [Bemisia tabaci]|uniref:Uncharacterized protein n=1 Tax=Bemisia tabaci TaxID=7038 RepID=A0A9P0ABV4_BEMTA|nr:unnamed protein product [Bemisia tabaci]
MQRLSSTRKSRHLLQGMKKSQLESAMVIGGESSWGPYNAGYSTSPTGYLPNYHGTEPPTFESPVNTHVPAFSEHSAIPNNEYSMYSTRSASSAESDPLATYQGSGGGGSRYDGGDYQNASAHCTPTPGGATYWTNNGTTAQGYNYPNYYGGNGGSTAVQPYVAPHPHPHPPPPPPPPPPPTMVLYPHLYSTVNQNQIHLHLHHSEINKPIEQFAEDVSSIVGGNNLTISSGGNRGIEIGILHHNQIQEEAQDVVITHTEVETYRDTSIPCLECNVPATSDTEPEPAPDSKSVGRPKRSRKRKFKMTREEKRVKKNSYEDYENCKGKFGQGRDFRDYL